ncbi:MAG: hypothetical protein MJE77_02655 [Proteobacteria bacterium]|nr:hypothetical protein [Pseudomonadota bacterium]
MAENLYRWYTSIWLVRSVNSKLLGNLARGDGRVGKHRRGYLHLFRVERAWTPK